jgi:hypothetical protein
LSSCRRNPRFWTAPRLHEIRDRPSRVLHSTPRWFPDGPATARRDDHLLSSERAAISRLRKTLSVGRSKTATRCIDHCGRQYPCRPSTEDTHMADPPRSPDTGPDRTSITAPHAGSKWLGSSPSPWSYCWSSCSLAAETTAPTATPASAVTRRPAGSRPTTRCHDYQPPAPEADAHRPRGLVGRLAGRGRHLPCARHRSPDQPGYRAGPRRLSRDGADRLVRPRPIEPGLAAHRAHRIAGHQLGTAPALLGRVHTPD